MLDYTTRGCRGPPRRPAPAGGARALDMAVYQFQKMVVVDSAVK